MGRPRLHDDVTRRKLLRAAETLVTKGGADALSVRRLAAAAGTSTRAVYSLFENMDGVFAALYREAYQALIREVDAARLTDDPVRDVVRLTSERWRRWALAHPNLFKLVYERAVPGADPRPEERAVGLEALKRLATLVQRCRDAGLLGGRDVEVVVGQISALCQGLASIELRGWWDGSGVDPKAAWEDAVGALLAGFERPRRKGRRA
jgi:AcrR family transcriptional regulator